IPESAPWVKVGIPKTSRMPDSPETGPASVPCAWAFSPRPGRPSKKGTAFPRKSSLLREPQALCPLPAGMRSLVQRLEMVAKKAIWANSESGRRFALTLPAGFGRNQRSLSEKRDGSLAHGPWMVRLRNAARAFLEEEKIA